MKTTVVVTSISAPNPALQSIATGCREHGYDFCVIGDVPSPAAFRLDGCDFFSMQRQRETGLKFAELCPPRHYARKNIGYLIAIERNCDLVLETDDDNFPRAEFWRPRTLEQEAACAAGADWVNVYRYFCEANVWPRGLPLDAAQEDPPEYGSLGVRRLCCPIQQGLADENPDVDAIYRLILPLPITFRADRSLILTAGSWCPFNSQNTAWWPECFPLLYLPAYCSMRMTDIWRSFVAQRIVWENGWGVLFHPPTLYQERNPHNLMRDFQDEIPGYLHNREIVEKLSELTLHAGPANMGNNLRRCYELLVRMGLVGQSELLLLDAWLADLTAASR